MLWQSITEPNLYCKWSHSSQSWQFEFGKLRRSWAQDNAYIILCIISDLHIITKFTHYHYIYILSLSSNKSNNYQEVARNRQMKKIPDIDMQVDDDAIKEITKFVKGFINFVQFVSRIKVFLCFWKNGAQHEHWNLNAFRQFPNLYNIRASRRPGPTYGRSWKINLVLSARSE